MAYDVEDKVVQMRFDNREFDPNIDASIKSLEKLEKSLQMANGTKWFENVEKSARNFNLNPALTAVEGLKNGFSTMEIVAITAISNITNKAIAMGNKLIQAFAIQPLTSGFSEYSEQMNSTQVILSNLSNETLPSVTASLDELNEYADRTIYSFGQMTQAIGKFAAAGVELKPATAAIKGLSSAAATVGANNQQLFSAYYNLAQSMQLGYLQLIDWKSLENSTIGNKTMREAFIRTAQELGTFTDATTTAEKAYADFRGSLQDKWLTSDVIVKTLEKYSRAIKKNGDAYAVWDETKKEFAETLREEKDAITGLTYYMSDTYGRMEEWEVQLAETAYKSATEIKSFKQMWETLTEAAGTGWAETWKIIFGDLNQAKELWTNIADPIQRVIDTFNNLRNEALQTWSELGGFEDFRDSLVNFAEAFGKFGDAIKLTLDKTFGTSIIQINGVDKEVSNITLAFLKATRILKIFSQYLVMSDKDINSLSDSLSVLLRPLRFVAQVLGFVAKVMLATIVMGVAIVRTIIEIAQHLALLPMIIDDIFGDESFAQFKEFLGLIFKILGNIVGLIVDLGKLVGAIFTPILDFISELLSGLTGTDVRLARIGDVFEFIGNVILFAINGLNEFINVIRSVVRAITAFIKGDVVNMGDYLEKNGAFSGISFVQGLTIALQKGITSVSKLGFKLGNALKTAFNLVLGIFSPSREAKKSMGYYVQGLVEEEKDSEGDVSKAGEDLAEGFGNSFSTKLEDIGKKGKKSKQEMLADLGIKTETKQRIEIKDFSEFNHEIDNVNRNLDQTTDQVEKVETLGEKVARVFSKIGETISTIWTNVSNFVKNISAAQVIIIAFSAAVILLIFNIARVIGEAKEVIEGFGRVVKGLAARIWAEAFDQMSQALFNIAKAIALLVLVANLDPEGMKQAVIVLGIFIGVISALVVVFSRLITITDKIKSIKNAGEALNAFGSAIAKVFGLMSIAAMVAALSVSIMMLTDSLATLSQIPTKDLWKGLAVLVILLAAMTAIILVLSKNTIQLTMGTVLIFAYSYALKLFSNALASISDGLSANIQKITNMTFKEVAVLMSFVIGLTVLSVYLNRASYALGRVIASLSLLSIGIGVMVALMGVFENNPVAQSFITAMSDWRLWTAIGLSIIGILVAFGFVSERLAKISKTTKTDLNKLYTGMSGLSTVFSKLGSTIFVIMTAMAGTIALVALSMSKFGSDNTIKAFEIALGSLILISGMLVGFMQLFIMNVKQLKSARVDEKQFDQINKALKAIVGSIIGLVATLIGVVTAVGLFYKIYEKNPEEAIKVLVTSVILIASVGGILAGLMVVMGRNFKGDNRAGDNILKAFIPIILLVSELLGALALFSTFKNTESIVPGVIAVTMVMLNVSLLLSQLAKISKDTSRSVTEVTKNSGGLVHEEASFANVTVAIIAILSSVAIFMAEIATLAGMISTGLINPEALLAAIISFSLIISQVTASIRLIFSSANVVDPGRIGDVFASLMGIFGALTILMLSFGGIAYVISRSVGEYLSTKDLVLVLGTITAMVLALSTAAYIIIKKIGNLTTFPQALSAFIIVLANLSGIIGLLAIVVNSLRGISLGNVAGEIGVLSLALMNVVGLVGVLIALSKVQTQVGDLVPIIVLLGNLSGVIALLGGIAFLLRNVNPKKLIANMGTLMLALTIMSAMASALSMISTIESVDASKIYAIAATITSIAIAVSAFGAVMYAFAAIDTNKVDQVTQLLGMMVISLTILAGVAAVIGAVFNSIGGWSGLVIAFFGAMTTVLLAFGVAVSMIANSDLDSLKSFLESLTNSSGGLSTVGQALWILVGACTALAVGLTLGGPGILIAAAAFLALAAALSVLVNALATLVAITDALQGLITVLTQIKGVLAPFGIFLGLLTLFAPGILVVSVAINLILISITAFIGALGLLSNAIGKLTTVMLPFVQTLRESGLYIAEHYKSFIALGTAISGLGTACGLAAPGLLALAGAIGIIIISAGAGIALIAVGLGVLLGLATPFIATLTIGFIALTAMIIALRNAFIEFLDAMMLRLPKIIAMLKELAPVSGAISAIGGAFLLLGIGLLSTSIGLIVASLGILALAGALKVLSLVVGPFEEFVRKLTVLADQADTFVDLSIIFGVFGLGLTALGLGSLVAAIGLLAVAGALAVLGNVVGSLEDFVAKLTYLSNQTTMLTDLTITFGIFGLGLTALGLGSLVAGIGLAALGGAIAIFNAIGFDAIIDAFSKLIELNRDGSIVGFGFSLIPVGIGLVAIGAGCIVASIGLALLAPALILAASAFLIFTAGLFITASAFTLFTTSLLALTSQVTGEQLMSIGAGIMYIGIGIGALAGAMLLLGAVSVIVSLVVAPIQVFVAVLMMLLGTIPAISNGIITLSNSFRVAATNIAISVLTISNAIKTAVHDIVEAINEVMNLAQQGIAIGVNLIAGFIEGIDSGIGSIGETMGNVINAIADPILTFFGIHSPSDWFKWVADMCTQGFTQETLKQCPAFQNAGQAAGQAAGGGFLNTIKNYFSGSKVGQVITSGVNNIKNKLTTKFGNIFGKNSALGQGIQTVKDIFSGNFDFSKILKDAGLGDGASGMFDNLADSLGNISGGLGDVGSAAKTTKGTLEELTDTIRNQMDVFSRFNDEDILDPKELIHNMESQIRGITNWANGIDTLAARGASAGLIQYLSELGPQGYKYVESFLEMTGDQFAKANDLFTQSLSIPDEAANTLLDGYRKSGAEIVEAVNEGMNTGIGSGTSAAVDTFDSAMHSMEESSSETGKKILQTSIDNGELTCEAIRTLAGEGGADAILYYSETLHKWLNSAQYEELNDEMKAALGEVWQIRAGDAMNMAGTKVDTSKTIFDHDYLNELSKKDGVFYLNGFGEALSSAQYISKCMEKGGQLLPATINEKVKPDELGNLMGKTAVEWTATAIELGDGDIAEGMEIMFSNAVNQAEDTIIDAGEESANAYIDSAVDTIEDGTTDLTNAVQSTWNSVRDASKKSANDYWNQMQSDYEKMMKQQKENAKNLYNGLKDNDSSYTNTGKNNGNAYINGFRSSTKINSPSKVMHENGMYLVEGLAEGIEDYMYLITRASEDMAENPVDTLADIIQTISSTFTDDIDAEPTIRPVIDMSNVDANADKLDTLFSTQQATIAANAQVKYSHDDSIAKLKAAYADVINNANAQLVMAIQKSEQPVNVNVTLQGDASTFFSAMVDQTRQTVAAGANNPFLITNRNSINAALI